MARYRGGTAVAVVTLSALLSGGCGNGGFLGIGGDDETAEGAPSSTAAPANSGAPAVNTEGGTQGTRPSIPSAGDARATSGGLVEVGALPDTGTPDPSKRESPEYDRACLDGDPRYDGRGQWFTIRSVDADGKPLTNVNGVAGMCGNTTMWTVACADNPSGQDTRLQLLAPAGAVSGLKNPADTLSPATAIIPAGAQGACVFGYVSGWGAEKAPGVDAAGIRFGQVLVQTNGDVPNGPGNSVMVPNVNYTKGEPANAPGAPPWVRQGGQFTPRELVDQVRAVPRQ